MVQAQAFGTGQEGALVPFESQPGSVGAQIDEMPFAAGAIDFGPISFPRRLDSDFRCGERPLSEISAMAESKTKATEASVDDYIASRATEAQRADCDALMVILGRATNQSPKMWGPTIVGYGSYRYTYESGRTGEACLTGFAIRGKDLVVYLPAEGEQQEALLSKLGKYKMGKACLYFKRLSDLDRSVLEQLVVGSVAELQRRHGTGGT